MWDLDDNEYIDYRCALGPITLGYAYGPVDEAVKKQIENGVLFSMASPVELEAAEEFLKCVKWADQVRFMKTGADANTCCVRLARSYTGRDHILSVGYHGYQDTFGHYWPNAGVPKSYLSYIHDVRYGDIEGMEKVFAEYGDQLACAITEPYQWNKETGEEFLARMRELCDQYGALLIFDEVLTGFRLALGGAQEFYKVEPDMGAYAKGMANGYAVSAYAGKKEFMQQLEKTVITTTYAGDALVLTASKTVMQIMQNEPVHEHINKMGKRLRDGFQSIIKETGAPAIAGGYDMAPFIEFDFKDEAKNNEWKNKLFNILFENGVFASDRWFINYSHQTADIDETLEKMRDAMIQVR